MGVAFDLVVLGTGSAGLATALRAARYGARVAVLDPGLIGGTCVNVGCVPKKAMWYAAQLARMQDLACEFGFPSTPAKLDWPKFLQHRQHYVEASHQSYQHQFVELGITVITQAARLEPDHGVLTAGGQRLTGEHIVIATGARPRRLDLPGFALGMVSDDMFGLRQAPLRLAIVGGGYVAVEFAGLMQALGSQVAMFSHGQLLAGFDTELVYGLEQTMLARGTSIDHGSQVGGLRRVGEAIEMVDAQQQVLGQFDALLWAVGRVPNSGSLGLQAVGVAMDEHGHIKTDQQMATNVAHIHAVGDVTTHRALTPVAVTAGRLLADRLFGKVPEATLEERFVPSVVFADPPLASVGLSEAAARKEHGEAVSIFRSRFRPMLWSLPQRDQQALMKVVCIGEDERVVGIHLYGPSADEILQGFAVAMRLGLRRRDLQASIAIHPSISEELLQVR